MEVQILADEGIPAGIGPDPAAEANATTKSRGGGFRGKKKRWLAEVEDAGKYFNFVCFCS